MTTKAEFRKFFTTKIKNTSKNKYRYFDKKIQNKLLLEILRLRAKNILLYTPLSFEVSMFELITYLRKCKRYRIFIPLIKGNTFKIVPFRLPLSKNKYNILESKDSCFASKVDLAIVPVIGIDGNFKRIGFGAGMYDRYFATLNKKPNIIFVSRVLNFTKSKITDSYDIDSRLLLSAKKNAIRGKYEFMGNIDINFCNHSISDPNILFHKKTFSIQTQFNYRASTNQSKCNRKRSPNELQKGTNKTQRARIRTTK